MKSPCIYAIENMNTGKRYVGSASNFYSRKKAHLSFLRNKKHQNILLQRSWDKHGESAFRFIVLEIVQFDRQSLIEREQHWIDALEAADPAKGYNIAPKAWSVLGVKHGPEVTAKRLAALAARTPEQKAATSEKLAAARRGYKHKPETLARMRGQKRSDETRARMSIANSGRVVSQELRAKISATLSGRKTGPQSPETVAKRVASTRATKLAKKALPS